MVAPAALADTLFSEAGYRKHSLRHRVNPSSLQQPLEHQLLGLALAPFSWPRNLDGLLDLWPHRSCPSRGHPSMVPTLGAEGPNTHATCAVLCLGPCVVPGVWYVQIS